MTDIIKKFEQFGNEHIAYALGGIEEKRKMSLSAAEQKEALELWVNESKGIIKELKSNLIKAKEDKKREKEQDAKTSREWVITERFGEKYVLEPLFQVSKDDLISPEFMNESKMIKKGIGYSSIADKIYLGKQNQEKGMWVGEKEDITSDFIRVLFQFIPAGTLREFTNNEGEEKEIVLALNRDNQSIEAMIQYLEGLKTPTITEVKKPDSV